ncbi:speckle-type POZ protein B-like [Fopius arisanus]|uniref:Speckle-type POZ protein B-like n=1 Tax=Fopius arisanus TaxID=64838 RepID=A0A0C9QXB3_9HYME|nr:PREDICTED: speckle-type POZ protein B-like [Fopius arisanus]
MGKCINSMRSSKRVFFSFLLVVSAAELIKSENLTAVSNKGHAITHVKAERIGYDWTVKNFSLLPQDIGEYLESPVFRNENNKVGWTLRFYPRGDMGYNYVSLFLNLNSHRGFKIDLKVHWQISIIKSDIARFMTTHNYTFRTLTTYGTSFYIKRSQLLNISRPDDTFTIRVEIDMPLKAITESYNATDSLEDQLIRDLEKGRWTGYFGKLFEEPKFSDVMIVAANETFPAHKAILATRSPVFAAILEADGITGNQSNRVKIENLESIVVKAMLEFIYTDEVTGLETLADRLLEAAEMFQLSRLKTMCELVLYRGVNENNAANFLILADLHRSERLKEHIMGFIGNHPAVMKSDGYKRIVETYAKLLMEISRAQGLRDSEK